MIRHWWSGRPLWLRLLLWYTVVGTVLLSGFSAILYFWVSEGLARPLDHQLRRDLQEIEKRLQVTSDGRVLWAGREVNDRTPWTTQYPWFELWDEDSHLVRRLWPFSENRVQQLPAPPVRDRETISVFYVAPDLRLRVLSVPYPRVDGPPWMIRMMRLHDPAADALAALRWIIFIALPTVIALLVGGGYAITRRWLSPLDDMAVEANRISAENLARRLPVENPRDELGRLARVFNETLDRLEASFTALDRFVADASHELRTPLTTLRSVGEVGLSRSRSVEEYREIIASMLEEAQRLQLLVGRLLELASAEGGASAAHRIELRIDECVRGCVADLGVLAEAKGQKIAVEVEACGTKTDPVLLERAIQNLIDNAVKYSPENTTIRVSARRDGGTIKIEVADRGPGISEENRHRLAERFFRPDRGRARATGGFGLGLSITKAYMRVLGGELEYRANADGGSTFQLVLPVL